MFSWEKDNMGESNKRRAPEEGNSHKKLLVHLKKDCKIGISIKAVSRQSDFIDLIHVSRANIDHRLILPESHPERQLEVGQAVGR